MCAAAVFTARDPECMSVCLGETVERLFDDWARHSTCRCVVLLSAWRAFKGGVSDPHMGIMLRQCHFFDARLTRKLIMKYR